MVLLAAATMLLAAFIYQANMGIAFVLLLVPSLLASLPQTLAAGRRLELLSANAEPTFAGREAVFQLSLPADPPVEVATLESPEGAAVSARMNPPENGLRRAELRLPAPHRGLFSPGELSLSTAAPLGLFKASVLLPAPATCLVYPAIHPEPATPLPLADQEHRNSEQTVSRADPHQGEDEFLGLRQHLPADGLARVAWKVSARQPEAGLLARAYGGEVHGVLRFVLDSRLTGPPLEEQLAKLCAALLKAEAEGVPYLLELGGRTHGPASGPEHLTRCLTALALYHPPARGMAR